VKPTIEAFNNRPKHGEQFRSPLTGVDLIVPYVKSARGIAPRIRGLVNWERAPGLAFTKDSRQTEARRLYNRPEEDESRRGPRCRNQQTRKPSTGARNAGT
jgi:hypothetical protein